MKCKTQINPQSYRHSHSRTFLNSRGINGKRTEHQNGRGVPLEGHPTPIVAMTYIIKNLEVKGLALKLRGTPGISLVLWWFCCVKFVSNN